MGNKKIIMSSEDYQKGVLVGQKYGYNDALKDVEKMINEFDDYPEELGSYIEDKLKSMEKKK